MLKLVKLIQEQIRKETGMEISEEQIEITLQGKKALFFDDRIDKIVQGVSIISIILRTNECCKEELLKECMP